LTHSQIAIWSIAALALLGVIVRPWRVPEYVWAAAGALLLVVAGLLPWRDALAATDKGLDVYLFLIGMMLLAEIARANGVFDALARLALSFARGSARKLFAIVYGVGTLVTVFMSNDATAVVLTPAVYSVARAAKVEALPYLYVCAFIANAASFVLPISNPANLVVFGDHMPPLGEWLRIFALPSVAAIGATFAALWWTQRHALPGKVAQPEDSAKLGRGGWIAAVGIAVTAGTLMTASALGRDLGWPTFVCGAAVAIVALLAERRSPWPVLRDISWSVVPLVAGLFVLVEGLNRTGVLTHSATLLRDGAASSPTLTAWGAGLAVALVSNVVNNLPMGLMAATIDGIAQPPAQITAAILIGVDLGPNLSVTGSLATILWLLALRREQEHVSALQFLKVGAIVMPPALVLALLALTLVR
jgi:arsenical pump membrane protein